MNKSKLKTIYNKSFTYVLPMLGKALNINPSDVCACYIGDSYTNDFAGHILLIFHDEFLKQNKDSILKNELFKDTYKHIEHEKQIFVFKVPDEHKDDFQKYIDGQYSKLKKSYKLEILSFHDVAKNSAVFHVLTRNETLRRRLQNKLNVSIGEDLELSSKPDIQFEYYSITHFTKPSRKMSENAVKRVAKTNDTGKLSRVVGVNSDGTLIHLVNNREIVGLRINKSQMKTYNFYKIILFKTKPLRK